jgi:hypothetical protein
LDAAGFEVLQVDAEFEPALFGCVQSVERLEKQFSNMAPIV